MVEMLIVLYVIVIQPFGTCREVQKKGVGWTCNTVDNTQAGVFFDGTNTLSLRGTVFNNHQTGLLLSPNNTYIGPQDLHGNRWIVNSGLGALNNSPLFALQSKFDVNTFPSTNFAPNNINALGLWFEDLILQNPSAINYDCNNPQFVCGTQVLPLAAPNSSIDALDISLANNTFPTSSILTSEYIGKRKLYRKLIENPSLVVADPSLPPFVPNHQNGCIGHFDNVAQQCSQAFALSSADSIQIDSFQNTCKYYLDTLHCLDSMLYANYDTITRNLRTALATDFGNIMQQHQAFMTTLNASQQSSLAIVATINSSFNTSILHENLEKQVNDIYFNTLALGIAEFTPSQIVDLQTIAAHCPQEGGAAVHQARGMLSMIQDVNMLDFDCNGSHARKAQNNEVVTLSTWEVVLYPNPAKEQITIQSNISLDKTATLEIYNLLGQQLTVEKITKETTSVDVNISAFIDGIYIIRIQKDGKTITKSFVVSK